MKALKSIYFFAFILIIFLLYTGCDSGSSSGDDPDYKIIFTINGTNYKFTTAHDDPSGVAEGCKDGTKTLIIADNAESPNDYVYFNIEGLTVGTFNDTTSLAFELVLPLANNFLDETASTNDFTFIITEFGEVGDSIKGTFTGQVKESGTANVYPLTNGFFEVKRKADSSIGLE